METTDRHQRSRSGPLWMLFVLVIILSLILGAVGEALLEPRVASAASSGKGDLTASVIALVDRAIASMPVARDRATAKPLAAATPTAAPPVSQNQAAAAPPAAVSSTDEPYVAVVSKVGPAVVTVVNQLAPRTTVYGGVAQPEALGSGVIVDREGHIVTNNHVVAGGDKFQVIFSDGRKVSAQLVGRDSPSDVAVLKVDGPVPAVAEFGDSTKVLVGQRVVAIGSALGDFKNTVTHGIVSGVDRSLADQGGPSLSGLIQTDAPINHGNSGGPLLNMEGQVIGLNTAVVRGSAMTGDVAEGLGFAIPSDTVQQIANDLIKNGFVARPYLGVNWTPVSPQIASYYGLNATQGALIQTVEPASPADKAGLKPGDVVTAVGATKIDDQHDFASLLMAHKIGDSVQLTVQRGQQQQTLSATLGERPRNVQ